MDKIIRYPKTISSAVRVDSQGTSLESALTTIAETFTSKADKTSVGELANLKTTDKTSIVNALNEVRSKAGGGNVDFLVETTWSALKALRDAGTLVAGMWYRITDYDCTTATAGTTSAGNHFDVIVRADSSSILNENAFACQSARDTDGYFANCKLEAWQLKYCIDNDTTRFAWADKTNGTGVIYYMKDEFENECPYDFKNIQFYRSYNSSKGLFSTINSSAKGVACYTFSDALSSSSTVSTDFSLGSNKVYDNVICEYVFLDKICLNNNCFFGNNCYANTLASNCYSNTFGSGCYANTFGNNCYNNILGTTCHSNTLENNCYDNTFGSGCYANTFGNYCYANIFGSGCYANTFGNYCYSNSINTDCHYISFGNSCWKNTLGSHCDFNSFGNECYYNSFGQFSYYNRLGNNCRQNNVSYNCNNNTFGNDCWYNTLGGYCDSNSFGNECQYNTVGDFCKFNAIGDYCKYVKFGTSSASKSYCQFITIENGVQYVYLDCTATTSSKVYFQNIHVNSGVCGTSSSYKTITIPTAGNEYLITVGTENDTKITV